MLFSFWAGSFEILPGPFVKNFNLNSKEIQNSRD